ncbi:MAG: hypothetical protein M3Z24_15355, partial [Chloroflexota bacterium]|nr:hypothetical protein [Chloroflexota bacterium]
VYAAERGRPFYDIFRNQLNMRLRVALKKLPSENLPYYHEVEEKILNEAIDRAWVITYRIMRGHVDTTNPCGFAMAKDLAYLWGYIIDKQLIEMGIGYINEAAIMASGGLQLLAEFSLTEDSLPLPYQDVATKYVKKILKSL